ncbi:MAG: NYN domain-containing protein [Anaerolineales bacterium]
MNYIIDGHNLIGKMSGLDLGMVDDELRLIELLNRFGQHNRGKVEVYFDGAPLGQAGVRNFGRVRAHFVPQRQTADEAIRLRLRKLGKSARNWVVVSSDRSVQAAGREAQARVMPAEDFAQRMQASFQVSSGDEQDSAELPLNEQEVNEWLELFSGRGKPK